MLLLPDCKMTFGGLIFKRAAKAQIGGWIEKLSNMFGDPDEKEDEGGSAT